MSVAFQTFNTDENTSPTSNYQIVKPTGLAEGDLMILQITTTQGTASITPPSGFTSITSVENTTGSGTGGIYLFSKIADAGDVAETNFNTGISPSRTGYGMLCRITGHRTTNYIGDYSSITAKTGIPSLDPTRANSLLMMFTGAFNRVGSGSLFSGYTVANGSPTWTEIFDDASASTDGGSSAAYADWTPSTATGDGSYTAANFDPDAMAGIMILITEFIAFGVTISDGTSLSEAISTPKIKTTNPIDQVSMEEDVEVNKVSVRNTVKHIGNWQNIVKS